MRFPIPAMRSSLHQNGSTASQYAAVALVTVAGALLAGCANLNTVHLTDRLGGGEITLVHGDAKQTTTALFSNPAYNASDQGKEGAEPQYLACPGKNPPVFSAYSASGSLGLGTTGQPSINASGSSSEIATALTPLAAIQINEDDLASICWDHVNNWLQNDDYPSAQIRIRNTTLAAFAFQALSTANAQPGSASPKGDPSDPGAAQTPNAADTPQTPAEQPKVKTPAVKVTKPGAKNTKPVVALVKKGDPPAKTPPVDKSGKSTGADSVSNGLNVNDAIVKIYDLSTSRASDVTPFCMKTLTDPEDFHTTPQLFNSLQEGCIQLLLTAGVENLSQQGDAKSSPSKQSSTQSLLDKIVPNKVDGQQVYFQVTDVGQMEGAKSVVGALRASGLPIVPTVQNIQGLRLSKSQVRYYYDEDRPLAQSVADAIKAESNIDLTLVKFPQTPRAHKGLVEVWISSSDKMGVNNKKNRIGSY